MEIIDTGPLTLHAFGAPGLPAGVSRTVYIPVFILVLLSAVLFQATPVHGSPTDLRIELLSPARVDAAPQQMITTSVRLTNLGSETGTFRVSADTQSDWQFLVLPEKVIIGPGDEEIVFISVTVPAETLAGDYLLTLEVRKDRSLIVVASVSLTVTVTAVSLLKVDTTGPRIPEASNGDIISQVFVIRNRGNTPNRIEINIDSHPGWPVSVDPAEFETSLQPGDSKIYNIQVAVPENLSRSLTHRLSFSVRSIDPPSTEIDAQANISTRIIPRQLSGSVYSSLEGDTQMLTSFQDDDETSYLVSIGPLKGELGENRRVFLELRNLLLDGNTSGTFVHSERLRAEYIDDDWGYIQVGDQSFNLEAPLIQRYTIGRGIDALLDTGKNDFRLFYSRTHGSSPRENTGVQVATDHGEGFLTRLTALRELGIPTSGDYQGGSVDSTNLGILTSYSPFYGTELTGEVGQSESSEFGTETAWRLAGRMVMDTYAVNCEWLRAGEGFQGGWRDNELKRVNMWWNPAPEFRIWGNYSLSNDNIANDPEVARRLFRNTGFGMTWKVEDLGKLYVSNRVIRNWDDVLMSYDSLSRVSIFSLSRIWDDLHTTVTYEHETSSDRLAGDTQKVRSYRLDLAMMVSNDAYLRMSYTMGRLSLSAVEGDSNTTNFTFGSQWRVSNEFRTSLNIQRNTGGLIGNRMDINGVATWEFYPDHNLNFRIRDYSGTFGSDTEIALEYEQPISISLGMFPHKGNVIGKLYYANEASDPVRNAMVSVGDIEVITDDNGQFEFPSLDVGEYVLSIDQATLGVGVRPFVEVPFVFKVHAGRTTNLEIPVIESASIEGTVILDVPASRGRDRAMVPMAEMVIELWGDIDSDFRVTDSNGFFTFSDLEPGSYTLILRPEYIPIGFEIFERQTYELELEPGDRLKGLDFIIKPEQQEIIFTAETITSE